VRRSHPGLGAGDGVEWLEAPAGVVAFARPGFVCAANTTSEPVSLDVPGRVLLASGGGVPEGAAVSVIPADTKVWWSLLPASVPAQDGDGGRTGGGEGGGDEAGSPEGTA
jgi:alpha-glucosidase